MKYSTILADPPWKYDNVRTGGSLTSGAAQKYSVLSVEDICNLPISDIADKNCILFLWITTPFLGAGFEVLNAWDFKYKTTIYWRKIGRNGLGFWFRGQIEQCLLGIKGKVKPFHSQSPNIIETKKRKHSQKPEEFMDLIAPHVQFPAIELFAREKRDNWDAFGDEIDSDIELREIDGKQHFSPVV